MSDDEADVPAALRDGRYRGLRVLGRGAQGTTFEATDVVGGRPVAIKRFVVRGARSWKEVELAEREATVLASLSHPLLPAYVEHFEEGGALYLVTSRIDGESLHAIRARGGRLDEAEIARMLRDLGEVLRHLHEQSPPIVHRDVKPGNVIRTRDGRYALVDFGSVRDRLKPEGGSTVVGTFGYMAPEQFQGRAMPQSDVYGVGATALAMLTGREPEDLPHRGLAIDVRAALGRAVPEPLVHALERMLDPDPDRRAVRVPLPLEDAAGRGARRRPGKRERERERERGPASSRGRGRDRRAEKRARKEERRRRDRAAWRRRVRIAGVVSRIAIGVALLVATIAVQIACRVVVPAVLVALGVIFGEPLRRAARQVAEAGVRATRAIDHARDAAWGLRLPDEETDLDPEEAAAAEDADGIRVRVVEPERPDAVDLDAEREAAEEEEALQHERPRRGRRL